MPLCPRCQTRVEATDLGCPACKLQLKAHGHPGVELHQAAADSVLCTTCVYHQDDSCTFPQRPLATTCTLYQSIDAEQARLTEIQPRSPAPAQFWQRYRVWFVLLALFGISLLLTVF